MQTKLAFLFVALVLIAGGVTRWWLAPEEVISTEVRCELSQGQCQFVAEETLIRISVSPNPIKVMIQHEIQVTSDQGAFTPEALEVTGLNMEMGLTRVVFGSAGVQAGMANLMLPICTQSNMDWQFLLKGRLNGQPKAYRWVLTTQR